MPFAESVPAGLALVVVEQGVVDVFANGSTCCATCSASNQCADERAGQAAE